MLVELLICLSVLFSSLNLTAKVWKYYNIDRIEKRISSLVKEAESKFGPGKGYIRHLWVQQEFYNSLKKIEGILLNEDKIDDMIIRAVEELHAQEKNNIE